MINILTGEVVFNSKLKLSSDTTEQEFIIPEEGVGLDQVTMKDGWSRYRPINLIESHGYSWKFSLYFFHSKLELVSMCISHQNGKVGWENWSEKVEMEQKKKHDDFLLKVVGAPPYKFNWGEIWSEYDPRSSESSIGIRYTKNSPPIRNKKRSKNG